MSDPPHKLKTPTPEAPTSKTPALKTSALKAYSFDVFDTCVTRYCAKPLDLFQPLFTRLLTQANWPTPHLSATAKTLARQRILAGHMATEQKQAQKTEDCEEITLADIYQVLAPQLALYGLTQEQGMAAEIEIELAAASPILSTQQQIQQLRSQGHLIIFISDMYLPGTVVTQMLQATGFLEPEDQVYVSSDVGMTNGSSKLFQHVCQQLKLAPSQLHHTGDNFYSDVRAAHKAGVKWTYFTQGDANRYEAADRVELLEDDWMRSHLIGLSRAIRLKHEQATVDSRQQTMLAANIIAPLFTGYVVWVLEAARQAGIQQLYYTDKLGEKLGAIAQILTQQNERTAIAQPDIDTDEIIPLPRNPLTITPPTLSPLTIAPLPSEHKATSQAHGIGAIIEAPQTATQPACFTLLVPNQHTPTLTPASDQPPSAPAYQYRPYLETALATQTSTDKFPTGTAHLSHYHDVLATLLTAMASDRAANYWDIVIDYATGLARTSQASAERPPAAQLMPQANLIKRYIVGNLIDFLTTPTTDDGGAFLALQTQTQPANNAAAPLAKPIPFHQVMALGQRTILHTRPQKHRASSWLEASISLSTWPIQNLFNSLFRPGHQLYRYVLVHRPLWLYRLIMRRQL